jgi:hypothetical protein
MGKVEALLVRIVLKTKKGSPNVGQTLLVPFCLFLSFLDGAKIRNLFGSLQNFGLLKSLFYRKAPRRNILFTLEPKDDFAPCNRLCE